MPCKPNINGKVRLILKRRTCFLCLQAASTLLLQVQQELEQVRTQYQAVLGQLQAKLAWYAQNQLQLTHHDMLLREQQELIAQLEQRLALHEGG